MKNKPFELISHTPVGHLEFIARLSEDSGLSDQFLSKVSGSTATLSAYLNCSDLQSVLFAVCCSLNLNHRNVDLGEMASWLGFSNIAFSLYLPDFEALCEKQLIHRVYVSDDHSYRSRSGRSDRSVSDMCWTINYDLWEAMSKNQQYTPQDLSITDTFDLIKAVSGIIMARDASQISYKIMHQRISSLLSEQEHLQYVKELRYFPMSESELALYLNVCDEFFDGNELCDLADMCKLCAQDKRDQMRLRQQIATGESILVTRGLVEVGESGFRNDKHVFLTPVAIEMLLRDCHDFKMPGKKAGKEAPDIILSANIPEKKLFFDPDVHEQFEFLSRLLQPENFNEMVQRLRYSGMKTGVAVLLEGPAGSGKTAMALELARLSSRDVMKISLSELRSKWYGQSERDLRSKFQAYNELVRRSSPGSGALLVFDECDGIFGTRNKASNSVDQTENTLQTILLGEMEDLNGGVLIATTNLANQLDPSFDRRFLFKIHVGRPQFEVRLHIWKDRFPALNDKVARQLAFEYNLSGGAIDNLSRKWVMQDILYGKEPSIAQLRSWCVEENSLHRLTKIGFSV